MSIVVVAAIFAVVVLAIVSTFARLLSRMQREHDRRTDLLVNQLCHLAGRDWQPAPASEPFVVPVAAVPDDGDRLILEEA
jgi:hypothetical protein